MRTVYYTASTMDGFIADPSDSLDWLFTRDQDHGGPLNYDTFIAGVGAIVMGSTTYEWVLRHEGGKPDFAWPYTEPCWVMTHRDLEAVADSIRFARGDVADLHPELVEAAQGKDVWVVGGGDLAGQFADAGLLDELIVYYAPVSLGAGRPLLPRRQELEVLEVARNRDFVCGGTPWCDRADPHGSGSVGLLVGPGLAAASVTGPGSPGRARRAAPPAARHASSRRGRPRRPWPAPRRLVDLAHLAPLDQQRPGDAGQAPRLRASACAARRRRRRRRWTRCPRTGCRPCWRRSPPPRPRSAA